MPHIVIVILSYFLFIPAVIGIIRYKDLDKTFTPFILLLCVGSVNEIISTILTYTIQSTVVNNNIYILAEVLLILWQFRLWRVAGPNVKLYIFMGIALAGLWVIECLVFPGLQNVSSYCHILYAFIIVVMAMRMLAKLIMEEPHELVKNAVFIICIGFSIFFIYKIIVECFWLYEYKRNRSLTIKIFEFMTWINLFVNILFCIAILCIPRKPRFITYSSLP